MSDFDERLDSQNEDVDCDADDSCSEEKVEYIAQGVSYSPNSENGGYSTERYIVTTNDRIVKNYESPADASVKRVEKRKKNDMRLSLGVIVIAFLLCVTISFTMGLGFAYLQTTRVGESPSGDSQSVSKGGKKYGDNKSYIDKTSPEKTEETVAPGSLMSVENAIEAVRDSVVEIITETAMSGFGGYSQYIVSGAGSGVIVSTGGYIITNNHVIEGARNIVVRLTDGSEYDAVLVGTDAKTDVAVISIFPEEDKSLTPAIIGSSYSLRLGQTVLAIGNPLGELGGTVTDGIISSLAREVKIDGSGNMTLIQTNAAVSPGNSGGGLFDLYGRLIGIVNAKTSGEGVEGISFAIPVDTAWDVACQLIEKGYVSGRPALGIPLKAVQYSAGYFGDVYSQVVVSEDYDAYSLKANDIIVSINGYEIVDMDDVRNSIAAKNVGDEVVVRIKRERKYYELKIKLCEYIPADTITEGSGN